MALWAKARVGFCRPGFTTSRKSEIHTLANATTKKAALRRLFYCSKKRSQSFNTLKLTELGYWAEW